MKVLHTAMSFYPDRGGGEGYLGALASRLQERGLQVVVAAPGGRDESYQFEGYCVHRFKIPSKPVASLPSLYRGGNSEFTNKFTQFLDEEQPDIVHVHARTAEFSVDLLRSVRRRRIPLVFTYHIATTSCLRGDLMKWGMTPCDGRLGVPLCTSCYLHRLGLRRSIATIVGNIPPRVARTMSSLVPRAKIKTALQMSALVSVHHESVLGFLAECDQIVTLCEWSRRLLLENGVPMSKIVVSQLGLCQRVNQEAARNKCRQFKATGARRIQCAFVGRYHESKGAHVLIMAMNSAPDLEMEVHFHGVAQDCAGMSYFDHLKQIARGDPRIHFHDPLPFENVVTSLHAYDVLAVPSTGLETGPFVVLEAFAAGIPVLGSDLGAINERVLHGVNGLLVTPGSTEAWSKSLRRLCEEPDLLTRLREGVSPPRTMDDVAQEMMSLYSTLAHASRS